MKIFIEATNRVQDVEGVFIEFGVYQGNRFIIFLEEALKQNKEIYGFDSFEGMPEPVKEDYDKEGKCFYPKGRLYANINEVLSKIPKFVSKDKYHIIKGFLPDTLSLVNIDKVSFAHIDLDQYKATKDVFSWIWDKLSPNGILLCDDYFPERNFLCAKAIDEFLEEKKGLISYTRGDMDWKRYITIKKLEEKNRVKLTKCIWCGGTGLLVMGVTCDTCKGLGYEEEVI